MKMKRVDAEGVPLKIRTWAKNEYEFLRRLYFDDDFLFSYDVLAAKWNPRLRPGQAKGEILGSISECTSAAEFRDKESKALKMMKEFLGKQEDKGTAFFNDVTSFLEANDLGKEWRGTIANFIVSGLLNVPNMNLFIETRKSGRKGVIIELNPDTSLADIQKVWPKIEEVQRTLRPNFKKENVTKKKHTNLQIAIRDVRERFSQSSTTDPYKLTDKDLVARLWMDEADDSESADMKRKANLRQIRRRISRKTL